MIPFTDALNEMRRKALLRGQPLTNQETQGLQSGFFDAAAALAPQTRANKLAEEQLKENRRVTDMQMTAADKAQRNALLSNVGSTAISTLGTDYIKNKDNSMVSKGIDYTKEAAVKAMNGQNPFSTTPAPNLGAAMTPASSFAAGGNANALVPAISKAAETGAGIGSLIPSGSTPALSMAPEFATEVGQGVASNIGTLAPASSFATQGGAKALSSSLAANTAPATGALGSLSAYMGPAGAGFAAPGLVNAIHGDSTENLGHNLSLGLVKDEGTANAIGSTAIGGLGGAVSAGAAAGSIVPGFGTVIGAGVGAAAGLLSSVFGDKK